MTKEEFQAAYLQAQDGLGNDIQSIAILMTRVEQLIEQISQDYHALNQVVEQYLAEE